MGINRVVVQPQLATDIAQIKHPLPKLATITTQISRPQPELATPAHSPCNERVENEKEESESPCNIQVIWERWRQRDRGDEVEVMVGGEIEMAQRGVGSG